MPATTWTKQEHATFAAEIKAAGYQVFAGPDRDLNPYPFAIIDCNSRREAKRALQDIIRSTSVYLTWDKWDEFCGALFVYPER